MIRRVLLMMAAGIFLSMQLSVAQEATKEANKKLEFKPYGFIKGDMFYATAGVYSWANTNNNYISTAQFASGVENEAIGYTAQHSRFGIKATTGDKTKVGGLLEIDFYGGAHDANTKPRLRLAYASIIRGNFEARMGQQWDLFSPNNANTVNTNGNLWFAGNMGFRRAQLQLSYKFDVEGFNPMIQVSLGEGAREEAGLGKDNLSGQPMLQARLSGKIDDKYVLGVSFVNAAFKEQKSDILAEDFNFNTSGIGFDFNLPFDDYISLTGEVNTGKNLNNANLFSAAGNYYYSRGLDNKKLEDFDRKSLGLWLNATSKLSEWLTVVVGYGMDKNQSDAFNMGHVEKNQWIYGDLIFPIKHGYSVALEVQNLTTTVVTQVDDKGKITGNKENKATVFALSGRVTF